jgi:hypothetical protein
MNRRFFRIAICLGIALAGNGLQPAPALAQQAGPDARNEAAQAVAQASYLPRVKQVYDVVILGDVLGTGLWAGMNRVVETEDNISVTGRIQENSGLGRPRLYNWPEAAAKLLEARQFDIAAIMLGANDGRDITTEAGRAGFGSDEWRRVYAERLRQFIKVLRDGQAAVYWFGVPPMASEPYDNAMKVVAGVERQVMAELGVRYIDLQLLLRGPGGSYTDSGDDGTGEVVRLRSRDGVKFITRGNDRLASELMKLVKADIAVAEGGAAPSAQVAIGVPQAALTPEQLAAMPVFAAERADGGDEAPVDPSALPGPDYIELAKLSAGQEPSADAGQLFSATRKATVDGSGASRLYNDGLWPDQPDGLPDPFSAPLQNDP